VLRNQQAPQVETLQVRAGTYAPSTTKDIFPLDLSGLSRLTMQGSNPETTVLDAEFRGEVLFAEASSDLLIEGFTIIRGSDGMIIRASRNMTVLGNLVRGNDGGGIVIDQDANIGNVIRNNIVESNGLHGITIVGNAAATVEQNISRFNGRDGIISFTNAQVDIIENTFEHNDRWGILIFDHSRATVIGNVVQHNGDDGIVISRNSESTVTENVVEHNGDDGIVIARASTIELGDNTVEHNAGDGIIIAIEASGNLRDNTVAHNGRFGILINSTSAAAINGGSITQNAGDGIRVGGGQTQPGQSTATIGLDSSAVLEISQNSSAGIVVEDDGFGSEAQIDSRNIVFDGNAEGETVGNVIDVAP
jgi:parallel beta-helix repeat protein